MYIPNKMKTAIANSFYDKTVYKLTNNESIDAEGGVITKGLTVENNFKGNVSFSNCKEIQEEYGLDYQIDIAITSHVDTDVAINDFIQYENIQYKVTDVLPSDSHILIVATKWR